MPRERPTPQDVEQWVRIGRDALVAVVATFMLIYATIWQRPPDEFVIGAGLALFGLIPAMRYDERRRTRGGNGDG